MSLQEVRDEVLDYLNTKIADIETRLAQLNEYNSNATTTMSSNTQKITDLNSDKVDYLAAIAKINA